jgi:hypothetical protein
MASGGNQSGNLLAAPNLMPGNEEEAAELLSRH